MWAQIIKTHLKPGMDSDFVGLMDQFKAIEQPDSGLLRTYALRDAKDPSAVYMMVIFESEEKARENERSPQQAELVRQLLEVFDGPPSFVDLEPVYEGSR